MGVFNQILELDDEDGFYQDMVENYLEQAVETIRLMDEYFSKRELTQLGKRGHFLKGSSAALGVIHVQEICEEIQHLGDRMDPDKESEVKMSVDDALARIKPLLARLKDEHAKAAEWFYTFERP
ncbi:histidine-phosphotransfer domain, HPT domain-containing protein [Gyrodon lividus]|nr:histidine-phosphotransfer domain, HPT domain-containing protein [Gyrodon lividus]